MSGAAGATGGVAGVLVATAISEVAYRVSTRKDDPENMTLEQRTNLYKGSYSITSLAMGTPFLRQIAEKCGEHLAR